MKKIVIALIMALMSLVAYGQTTKGEIWDNFKQGGFYLIANEDSDILFFKVDFDTVVRDYETRDIVSGVFTTNVSMDFYRKASDWFVSKMKTEEGAKIMTITFYDNYRIVIGDDFKVNPDGSATVTMTLII